MSTWFVVGVLVLVFLVACWLVGVYNRLTALRRLALESQAHLLGQLRQLDPWPATLWEGRLPVSSQPRVLAAWAQLLRLCDADPAALMHSTQAEAMDAAWTIWVGEVPVGAWLTANGSAATLAQQARQNYLSHVTHYNQERVLWPARLAAWAFGFRRAGVAAQLLDNAPSE